MHHAGNPVHWALGLTTLKGDRAQLWPPPATTTELCADPRVDPFPVPSQLFHFRRERELLRLRSSWQQLAELPKKGETARVVVGRVVVTLRLGSWAAAPTTQRQQLATCWWPSCCDTKVQRNGSSERLPSTKRRSPRAPRPRRRLQGGGGRRGGQAGGRAARAGARPARALRRQGLSERE